MGKLTFLLPENLGAGAARELERACVAGGPDSMPWFTNARVEDRKLILSRNVEESGFVQSPWEIPEAGLLMGATTTLMEREAPYDFEIEMARGKVNQLRSQAEEWRAGGLPLTANLEQSIHDACISFGRAALDQGRNAAAEQARRALTSSYEAAHALAQAYISRAFQVRHEKDSILEVDLGCRLTSVPQSESIPLLGDVFNHLDIPFPWRNIEPTEGVYQWQAEDALVNWADEHSFPVSAGPLIDFTFSQLPAWLADRSHDPDALGRAAANYVIAAMKRYGDRIRRWHLITGANSASVFSLTE